MRILICIHTYNEAENIKNLIDEINGLSLNFDILIIDDNSPDGTGDLVKNLQKTCSNLNLIERKNKLGLASAYLEGFRYGVEHQYDYIGEMDADFSHPPSKLKEVHSLVNQGQYDFLVGSRYISGGKVVNWGIVRKLVSKFGSLYARIILNIPILDMTGGFNFWSRSTLKDIDLTKIVSDGYVFQIELKTRAYKIGKKYYEFRITFEDRRVGQSKMSKKIFIEAFYKVLILFFKIR